MSERRRGYDAIARQYDRARPSYPAALFDDIVDYAKLEAGARLLEIGCGTGQATLPLARRGFAIDAIELGANLAALAHEKLAQYPNVQVINADFESLDLRPQSCDLVYAATAFHWLDPAISFRKAHNLLKSGGSLALFWHRPVMTPVSRDCVAALQTIYRQVAPAMARQYILPPKPAAVRTEYERLIPESGLFGQLQIRKHYALNHYSAGDYIQLLGTFSDHIALPKAQRAQLFAEITALINRDFAGAVPRETVALLYLARATSAQPAL